MEYKARYKLLTFYKFVTVDSPQDEVKRQFWLCRDLGLRGRIYIGEEGINATVSGTPGQLWAYRKYLNESPYFGNIPDVDIKASDVPEHAFEKMIVRYRKEIVALGKVYSPEEIKKFAQVMPIEKFKEIQEKGLFDQYAILDMRNNYEYKLGHFKGAEPAGTVNFRELEKVIEDYKEKFKDKKIVMYCTGGIRCEKATVMFREKGFDEIYQLDGGVVKYIHTYDDGSWLGNLYTFDGVISKKVGSDETHVSIGECIYTGHKTDHVENCRYSPCNARIICRRKQYKRHFGFCSKECRESGKKDLLIKNVDFDGIDYPYYRDLIKKDPSQQERIVNEISEYLDGKLKNISFAKETSQKEEYVLN